MSATRRWSFLRSTLRTSICFKLARRADLHLIAASHSESHQLALNADAWEQETGQPASSTTGAPNAGRPSSFLVQVSLLALLVSLNANDVLLKAYSQRLALDAGRRPYSISSVMLLTNAASVLTANLMAAALPPDITASNMSRLDVVKQCWLLKRILLMTVPAAFFSVSTAMKFLALCFISAADVLAVDQCGLLLCALVGWAFMGKQYSFFQWLSLLGVSVSVYWYGLAKGRCEQSQRWAAAPPVAVAPPTAGDDARLCGLLLMMGSALMSCFGGLVGEILLKQSSSTPFFVSKAHLDVGGTVSALIACLLLEPAFRGSCSLLERGLFGGWDCWTAGVAAISLCKSWVSGMVVRVLDNLAFSLAGTTAMLLVYLEQQLLPAGSLHEEFDKDVFLAVLSLATAVASFAVASQRAAGARKRLPRLPLQVPLLERTRKPKDR